LGAETSGTGGQKKKLLQDKRWANDPKKKPNPFPAKQRRKQNKKKTKIVGGGEKPSRDGKKPTEKRWKGQGQGRSSGLSTRRTLPSTWFFTKNRRTVSKKKESKAWQRKGGNRRESYPGRGVWGLIKNQCNPSPTKRNFFTFRKNKPKAKKETRKWNSPRQKRINRQKKNNNKNCRIDVGGIADQYDW